MKLAHKLSICAVPLAFITVIPTKPIELSGRIRGVVSGLSGAVIAGATVSVMEQRTGILSPFVELQPVRFSTLGI